MTVRALVLVALLVGLGLVAVTPGASRAAPEGQITWGVHVTLAPTWFDPAEAPGLLTPYMGRDVSRRTLWVLPSHARISPVQ